ncbi:5776_t:CDS:2, partial [Dentiscutata heterogama]
GGAGKSGIVSELLSSELYVKPKKQKSGSNWWNGYNKHEIVLFDEWYTCIDWNDIVKYLNDTPEDVEQKHKGFIPFLAKYVFITSHKPPEEAFNFRHQRTTELIFYKGSEEDFRNMNWDVKYCKGEFTVDELKTIVQDLNQEQDDHDDINISNSRMMLDDNYFVQKPVEVIEMTDEYASNQD